MAAVWVFHTARAAEFHVSPQGNDANPGTVEEPLRTIQRGAELAHPGDVVTVHEGTYRERITPPRGGESDQKRIVYQAAAGERVIIKGSEAVRDWKPFAAGVWKATLPNSFFGHYNPYKDLIAGDWFADKGRPHHTGEVYLNGKSLFETHLLERLLNPPPPPGSAAAGATFTWFAESDEKNTYLYANFHELDPNRELVEINVRDSCFYPDQPGRNYITVRGFHLCQAATQWAAPTAEQMGLIGTHWSKGWIIEHNVISDSKCVGITLGKDRKTGHNVWSKDPSKDGATHYNEVVVRALEAGWSRERIGSHIVRNNTVYNCEEAGICGSLGAAFSQITSNHVYNIWTKRQFAGAEIAGIKIHAAIDVRIQHNRIDHAGLGLWMDWMAQGTRITGNLCYENSSGDLFVEVNHGPFLVDHNLFLSGNSLDDMSEGGAYAHNLFAGQMVSRPEPKRFTPYHRAHATALAGWSSTKGGDDRFYNNLFVGHPEAKPAPPDTNRITGFGLWVYNTREGPLQTGGNFYGNGARPYMYEMNRIEAPATALPPKVIERNGEVYLEWSLEPTALDAKTSLVTTEILGKTRLSGLAFENPDGSPLVLDTDYFGARRSRFGPTAGPFEHGVSSTALLRVW